MSQPRLKRPFGVLICAGVLLLAACQNDPAAGPKAAPSAVPSVSAASVATAATGGAAASQAAAPAATSATAASASPAAAVPPAVTAVPAVDGSSVAIGLAAEPLLASPVTALVGTKPQRFDIAFPEAMNRGSVEQTVRRQLLTDNSRKPSSATVSFTWKDSRSVEVTVTAKAPDALYPTYGYVIDVTGASTAAGALLNNAPAFRAQIARPQQIAAISADGSSLDPVSSFDEPYNFELLPDLRYALAWRTNGYCECDATFEKLSSVYDLEAKKLVRYPLELDTNYSGPGRFVADTRGFFFDPAKAKDDVPASPTAYNVKVDGNVYGATFSRDRKQFLVLTGVKGRPKTLDAFRVELASGNSFKVAAAIPGSPPESMVSSALLDVPFYNMGNSSYFAAWDLDAHKELRYVFDWDTGKLGEWNPPTASDDWAGFIGSDDGKYQYHWNGGLYEGSRKVDHGIKDNFNRWIPGTHSLLGLNGDFRMPQGENRVTLSRMDADRKTAQIVRTHLPDTASLLGTNADGSRIYVAAPW